MKTAIQRLIQCFLDLLHTLDNDLIQKIMTKKDVVDFVFAECADPELRQWLREHGLSRPISDVVAGKIDVRGVEVPEFAPVEEETSEKKNVLAEEDANE